MSYRPLGNLQQLPTAALTAGAAAQLRQQATSPVVQAAAQRALSTINVAEVVGAAKDDPFFPKVCQQLDRYVPVPSTIPAGVAMVRAWPIVKARQNEVDRYLDFLTDVQNRRWRLPNSLINLWMENPSYFQDLIMLAAGWIPEGENTSFTRGTLWIAVSYTKPKSKSDADRLVRVLNRYAKGHAGISDSEMPDVGAPALAPNQNDEGLLQGAYRSALAMGEFAAFIRTTFTLGSVARPSKEIAAPIRDRAAKVARAAAVLQQVPGLPATIGAVVAQAKQVEPVQGQLMLDNLLTVLRDAKSALLAGEAAAPAVVQDGVAVRDRTLGQMREAILSQARDYINRNVPFQIAREFVRCWTLAQAWRSLKNQIDALLSDLVAGILGAQTLLSQKAAIAAAVRSLDEMIEKVEFEKSQLPLEWWQRTKGGLPVWGWAGVGAVAFVGGAVALRRFRKKRVKPNRRRRRRSSRRRS